MSVSCREGSAAGSGVPTRSPIWKSFVVLKLSARILLKVVVPLGRLSRFRVFSAATSQRSVGHSRSCGRSEHVARAAPAPPMIRDRFSLAWYGGGPPGGGGKTKPRLSRFELPWRCFFAVP